MEKKLVETIRKIASVGPESTGKSCMARRLAGEYKTWYVPEYSRYYCQGLDRQYTIQDELNIFYGQLALEDSIVNVTDHSLLFFDTTILTVKIWSDYLFGRTPDRVIEEIKWRHYDHYLLLNIDLPWEDDPLRDFPDKREYFMEIWEKELIALKVDYTIVSGAGEDRYQKGIELVRKLLK